MKENNNELLFAVARALLALGSLITGESYILITGEKIRKKSFTTAIRQLRVVASKLGIRETDPVEDILNEAIKLLNQNENHSGAQLIEQLKERKLIDGKNDDKI